MKNQNKNASNIKSLKKTAIKDNLEASMSSATQSFLNSSKQSLNTFKVNDDSTTNALLSYKPIAYVFRFPNNMMSGGAVRGIAKCPPFFIQLDHTLAVIWTIFSKQNIGKQLGIAQLQWALSFLRGIRNAQGTHSKDIAICIETIEDALLEKYASMLDTIKIKKEESFEKPSTCNINNPIKQTLITHKLPVSISCVNSNRFNTPDLEQLSNFPNQKTKKILQKLHEMKQILNEVNKAEEFLQTKSNLIEQLRVWRKERINKLYEDLKKLHSIESFMSILDKDNSRPYLNNWSFKTLELKKFERGNKTSTNLSVNDTNKNN